MSAPASRPPADSRIVPSGIPQFDRLIGGVRLGDNVVWQVDDLQHYRHFARAFAHQAIADKRKLIYLRFSADQALLEPHPGLEMVQLDPGIGFDPFCATIHTVAENAGRYAFYVFDNLSALVAEWATDELLANFFQFTCPFLFQLDTVAFFGLYRNQHAHSTVARIRDTTQLLVNVYRTRAGICVHPLKAWDRYSPLMFLPHQVGPDDWEPVYNSDFGPNTTPPRRSPLAPTMAPIAPWDSVYQKLRQHVEAGDDQGSPEAGALRNELSRMLIGDHPEFNRLANQYLASEDLLGIRERLVGSGRIGGKAGGMLLARRILLKDPGEFDFAELLEDHDSFFIGSDVFFSFLVHNDLFRVRLQLSQTDGFGREDFEELAERFRQGRFPPEIMAQFQTVLDYYGQAPIIVRSSSLLEDSFGNAFAGKYRSEFCANQGTLEQRLEAFVLAVKNVYASALNPDALAYRRRRGLGHTDELMAILVQRVSGRPCGEWFFPAIAGVAFSRNLYAWTNRIDSRKGMLRMVLGLGTQAVNRIGGGYPRMVALSHPLLRPESGHEVARYSQREVDLISIGENRLKTVFVGEVLKQRRLPNRHLFVSEVHDGSLYDPMGCQIEGAELVPTFNNLLRQTPFARIMAEALAKLERAYQQPVDTEFTARFEPSGNIKINLLQCRPLRLPGARTAVSLPTDVPAGNLLFRANRTVSGGIVRDIRYILYIDPEVYARIPAQEQKQALGRTVGRVNALPPVRTNGILLIGPGRWGSSNIDLGVRVSYSEIENTTVLVELASEKAGHAPEVSYGTHFFQDLVESQVVYLPVYPDDAQSQFNRGFFRDSPNSLGRFLPDLADQEPLVRLLDVQAITGGPLVQVVADPQSQAALCFLGRL